MPSMPELGLFLPSTESGPSGPRDLSFARLLEITRAAEDAGYHSVWFPDHYFIEQAPGKRRGGFECWTLLAALAARTSRIKLGNLVLCNTFRHPAVLAKQATSLQEISDGRIILGLGAGWHEPEYKALGLPFTNRVSRLGESADAIRELFDTGTSSFEGRFVKLEDAELFPRPATKVPLWIAASGPKMLEIVARSADGWNLAWFGSSPRPFANKVAALREAIVAAGRPRDSVTLTVGIQALITASGAEAEAAGIAEVKRLNPGMASLEDAQVKQRTLVGDAEAATAALQGFAEAGASLAIIGMPGLSSLPALDGALDRLLALGQRAAVSKA